MDLHRKYRPEALDKVIGQTAVTKSLGYLLQQGKPPHAILLSGPSGVGKTTIARIFSKEVEATLVEVDGATYTGIDSMRTLTESLQYKPLHTTAKTRCIIIDECHALSRASWQSLLKSVEEPPNHVFFCFCTTEIDKVPKTIVTRCQHYPLQLVSSGVLEKHIIRIAKKEGIKLNSDSFSYIARHSMGSVRQSIVYLSTCATAKSLDEVKALVASGAEEKETVDLFRLLVSGRASWYECLRILSKLEETGAAIQYESVRIGLVNYIGVVLNKTKDKNKARQLLAIVEAFSKPFNRSTERSDFLLALGTCLL